MGGADDSGRADEFLAALGRTLEAHGWWNGERTVLESPPPPDPLRETASSRETVIQRFDRPVADGWVARLTVTWLSGSEIRFLPPRTYVRHFVRVSGAVTVPAAEDLARRCGSGESMAIESPVAFAPRRSDDGDRRVRGPRDYDAAAGEVAGYAEHALLPWARAHADLKHWFADLEEWLAEGDDPSSVLSSVLEVSAMLAVHGRGEEALAGLEAARHDPRFSDDQELEPFTERLTAFVETGVLPDLPPEPPAEDLPPPAVDRTAEDPIRKEFYAGFNAELGEESLGTQWRYFGRQLQSAARMVRALGGDGPSGLTWWAPVAVGVEVEELLDRVYEAAGPPVDRRVGLQVELGGRGSGPDDGVEVRIGLDVVGVLRSADIPTWGTVPRIDGTRRAKLRRKRERPRFLLEVDIG